MEMFRKFYKNLTDVSPSDLNPENLAEHDD
jgi:hypothetical protein